MKAFCLVVLTLLMIVVVQSGAGQEESWVGEIVLPIKPAKEIKFSDRVDGKQISFAFSDRMSNTVRDDRNGRLRIHDGGHEAWVDKADFVLLRNAPAYFQRRVLANPKDYWALFMRGVSWLHKGELDVAIIDFDECIRLNPTALSAFVNRGSAWLEKGDYDKAIKDYDEAIRRKPKESTYFMKRGYAWNAKREYDRAIKDFSEVIHLDPQAVSAFRSRANAWMDKREFDQAIKDYDAVIRLDPKAANAFSYRGYAWRNKKQYDKALKDFDEAIRLDPKNAFNYSMRASVWDNKKQYDKAIKNYDEAIRLEPQDAKHYDNRGLTWLAWKENDKAIKDFDEAIRLDPKNVWPYLNKSVAQMLRRRPEAIGGFKKVIDLHGGKGLGPYAAILGQLAARQNGDEMTAMWFLKDPAGKFSKTWPYPAIQYLRGEIDEPALLKLATDEYKRTEAHCYLGLDLALKGRKREALAHFRWVKEHSNTIFIEDTIALVELERWNGCRQNQNDSIFWQRHSSNAL